MPNPIVYPVSDLCRVARNCLSGLSETHDNDVYQLSRVEDHDFQQFGRSGSYDNDVYQLARLVSALGYLIERGELTLKFQTGNWDVVAEAAEADVLIYGKAHDITMKDQGGCD